MYRIAAAALLALIASASPAVAAAPGQADCTSSSPTGAVVQQWSGKGDRNTEPFTTTGAPLRMTFTTTGPTSYGPQLCWRMHSTSGALGPGGCIQQASGETFVYMPAGTWYLSITPMGDYSVSLEQL